ncbi:CLUMA_CG013775, isoform A [Clunio marinus]|uniref:CLUMA_CG013775, isoform A n=1 Tax=Clunio marinus TaxID=568069 RepID=A0A1J1IL76_9DIPT|nr:CLUMA_CG013775, isoform A [Clunio marinus]
MKNPLEQNNNSKRDQDLSVEDEREKQEWKSLLKSFSFNNPLQGLDETLWKEKRKKKEKDSPSSSLELAADITILKTMMSQYLLACFDAFTDDRKGNFIMKYFHLEKLQTSKRGGSSYPSCDISTMRNNNKILDIEKTNVTPVLGVDCFILEKERADTSLLSLNVLIKFSVRHMGNCECEAYFLKALNWAGTTGTSEETTKRKKTPGD